MAIPLSEIPRGNSLSSSLMTGVTLYRNVPRVFNKIQAQFGYALVFVSALVETAVALAFTLLSTLAIPFSREPFNRNTNWLISAAFTIGWSFFDFIANPFSAVLAADEPSAMQIASGENYMGLPHGVLL